jgi:hypothetical protein
MKAILFALALFHFTPKIMANEIPSTSEKIGSQKFRILIQIRPEDILCVDAHTGAFGQEIPGVISFHPMKGDTGFWWNKITDYNQRVTRIEVFQKILRPEEKCADFYSIIPRSNGYFHLEREVFGRSIEENKHRIGILEEKVDLIFSEQLVLSGSFQWKDWKIPSQNFDPKRKFRDTLINEFSRVESDVSLTLSLDNKNFNCRWIDNRMNLVIPAQGYIDQNAIHLRRVYADENDCFEALTDLSQAIAAKGNTWQGFLVKGKRMLSFAAREASLDQCDSLRVERIETEIEGLKFIGRNFITLDSSSQRCRR